MISVITPSTLFGKVEIPSSKSIAHRALICAALSEFPSKICGKLEGDDLEATIDCLEKLGARFIKTGEDIVVTPIDKSLVCGKKIEFDARESGTTLRFLLSISAMLGVNATFCGTQRLLQRPLNEIVGLLEKHNVIIQSTHNSITISNKLASGEFIVEASKSSQFASGLLLAAPLGSGKSVIKLEGEIASQSYLALTKEVMQRYNVCINQIGNNIFEIDKQPYFINDGYVVECDWSSAAFFIVAAALTGELTLCGINENSGQGDRMIIEVLKEAGGYSKFESGSLVVKKTELQAVDFDASDCPDIVPIAAVLLAKAKGISHIKGVGRLKYKESDRLYETIKMLDTFGVKCQTDGDVLTVYGGRLVGGGEIILPNDHRIAMAAAVAAVSADFETTLRGMECIKKSYPDFLKHLESAGGKIVAWQ